MSLSTDALAKGTPTRLICRAGRWVLELTRLEAVDRDVYQPRLTRLEGTDSILAVLRRSDEGQLLATGAAQIMRSPRSDEDRAFEVSEGDWVPSTDSALPTRQQQVAEAQGAEAGRAISELRAELAVLRASHARLRDRVVALEAAQSGIAQPNLRLPRGARSQRRRSEPPPAFSEVEAEAEALAENPGFAATQASPALGAPAVPAGPAARPVAPVVAVQAAAAQPAAAQAAPGHQSFEELAKSLTGEQPLPLLGLPTLRRLSDCLATLMDAAPALEQNSRSSALEDLVGLQVCKLLDDEGRERGAILLDLRAAVLLGAALLAVPRDEALRQLNENEPSEDALLATSEICNNLTGPVNAVEGNEHVRSTALTSADVSGLPKARARLDLSVDGGQLVFMMF
jgi:hypothetical protein